MKKGFTLLELVIVIIIIGILATLGFTQFAKVVEKGRTTEARTILGTIRSAQEAYKLEYGVYAVALADLPVGAPADCSSQETHYFSYSVDTAGTLATATRCTTGGKSPVGPDAYTITLNYATGKFGGSAGYY